LGECWRRAQFTAKLPNFQRQRMCGYAAAMSRHGSALSLLTWRLFHGHTLCEIAWLIDVAAQLNCQVIREKLKRDEGKNGHYVLGRFRQHDYFVGNFFEALRAVSAGHRNDGPLARLNLFDVVQVFGEN